MPNSSGQHHLRSGNLQIGILLGWLDLGNEIALGFFSFCGKYFQKEKTFNYLDVLSNTPTFISVA